MRWTSLVQAAFVLAARVESSGSTDSCHCLPQDDCWPSDETWKGLNATLHGKLSATVPIGSPCHDPTYNAEACATLQEEWLNPLVHISSSSSIMQTYFANQSCDPFTDRTKPCQIGNYVSYSALVASSSDVAETLKFAKENNIRIVIRNTGHDFLGRSTGAGALAIWTQDLKDIEFQDWSDKHYNGPAVKIGAGVLGYEILEAAHAEGFTVLTGECATVGLAGGFIQAGGHSALSTAFGLGSDQVLEYQVVTADGRLVTASPDENTDLYWALSGGGGGTFGVVVSATLRAYTAAEVGGAAFQLFSHTTTQEKYDAAVLSFWKLLPGMVDHGAMVVFYVNKQMLVVRPLTVWDSTMDYVREEVLAPFEASLEEIGIDLPITYSQLPYRDHYDRYMGPLPQGNIEVNRFQFGGRLIPRRALEDNFDEFMKVIDDLNTDNVLAVGGAGLYKQPEGAAENSVHPAWRDAIMQLQLVTFWDPTASWETMEAAQHRMTNEFMPKLEAVTPGSGSYLNEADFRQPNWQDTFYGPNYEKLSSIKRKWDPESVFYVLKGVGSEAWTVGNDGKMCRA